MARSRLVDKVGEGMRRFPALAPAGEKASEAEGSAA
jgi:hypothetical protein